MKICILKPALLRLRNEKKNTMLFIKNSVMRFLRINPEGDTIGNEFNYSSSLEHSRGLHLLRYIN